METTNTYRARRRRVFYRLFTLAVCVILAYAVGRCDGHRPNAYRDNLIKRQHELLQLYSDLEWKTDAVLDENKVDSSTYTFNEYQKQIISIVEFYNADKNEDIAISLN